MNNLMQASVVASVMVPIQVQADCNGNNCYPHWDFDCDSDSDCIGNGEMMSISAVKCGNANCPYGDWFSKHDCCVIQPVWKSGDKIALYYGWDCDSDSDCDIQKFRTEMNTNYLYCGNANAPWTSWGSSDDVCVATTLWKSDDKIALHHGWDCDSDSDCDLQLFKTEMNADRLYCGNANAPWESLGLLGYTHDDVCVVARPDGEKALSATQKGDLCPLTAPWCYSSCASNHGICGVCGWKNADGEDCDTNEECESGACQLKCIGVVATTAGCSGKCKPKLPDGAALEKLGCWDILGANGITNQADYDLCESGVGFCGICGHVVPKGSKCTKHTDCAGYSESAPEVCCGKHDGTIDTENCGGMCVNATPKACRSTFEVAAQEAFDVVEEAIDEITKFAECIKEGVEDIVDNKADSEDGCEVSLEDTTLGFKCRPPLAEMNYGTADNPKNFSQCSERAPGTCPKGFVLEVFAEASLTPGVSGSIDVRGTSMNLDLDIGFQANVGVAASLSALCTRQEEFFFPKVPVISPAICLPTGLPCFVLTFQTQVTLLMDGMMSAGASAEFGMGYDASGSLSFELNPAKWEQSGAGVDLGELTKAWRVQASSGTLSGSVSVQAGPKLSIVMLPGIVISVNPYATAQASVCGTGVALHQEDGDLALLKNMTSPGTCGGGQVDLSHEKPCLSANVELKTGLNVNLGLGMRGVLQVKEAIQAACNEMMGTLPGMQYGVVAIDCVGKALANDQTYSLTNDVCETMLKVFDVVQEEFPLVEAEISCTDLWSRSSQDSCSSSTCPTLGCSAGAASPASSVWENVASLSLQASPLFIIIMLTMAAAVQV